MKKDKTQITVIPYKFAKTGPDTIPTGGKVVECFEKLNKGIRLNRNEKNYLFHCLQGNTGKHSYRLLGWVFPFGPFFKTYIVKYKFSSDWTEIKAPDKTAIRTSYLTRMGILEIKEL